MCVCIINVKIVKSFLIPWAQNGHVSMESLSTGSIHMGRFFVYVMPPVMAMLVYVRPSS